MLSWLFPYRCILCLAPGDGRDLCRDCTADLPWAGSACPRCARPLPAGIAGLPCGRCLRRPPPQASTLAAFRYAFPVDQMVLKLKFGDDLVAGRVLGELLADRLSSTATTADLVVPVPLHRQRLRERGYNQALEIARPVARRLALPLRPGACRRLRATEPQSALHGKARFRNPAGAFAADESVRGKRVALVDDVITTGSTVSEVARALRRAGAAEVIAWCVARA